MNRAALTRIREHLVALPGKASKAHISLFAKIVNDRLADEKDPLHEDLKYRYLASSLVITKDDPFTLGAQKQVAYLDELLSEVRLQTLASMDQIPWVAIKTSASSSVSSTPRPWAAPRTSANTSPMTPTPDS